MAGRQGEIVEAMHRHIDPRRETPGRAKSELEKQPDLKKNAR